jgi:uroporphyrinogen-III synthase/uroporphyrinogen III methyltransferase/synthase
VTQPLGDRRVLVTRSAHQATKLSDGLRALGAVPVEVPILEILPPTSYEPLDTALQDLSGYDWLVVTSANTVDVLAERAAVAGVSLKETGSTPEIAAIGNATAKAAHEAGLTVSLTPESYVAESLVAAMSDHIAGKRVLLARASMARDVIPDALRKVGATVDVVDAYRNVLPEDAPRQLRAALAKGLDAATFTSSSSVTHLEEAARAAGLAFPLRDVPAISIGPITSQTLRERGWPPAVEADPHDIPGLVAAVVRRLGPAHR